MFRRPSLNAKHGAGLETNDSRRKTKGNWVLSLEPVRSAQESPLHGLIPVRNEWTPAQSERDFEDLVFWSYGRVDGTFPNIQNSNSL